MGDARAGPCDEAHRMVLHDEGAGLSASAALSRTSALPRLRPKLFSPSFSQSSPTRVSQPVSLVSAGEALRRATAQPPPARPAGAPRQPPGPASSAQRSRALASDAVLSSTRRRFGCTWAAPACNGSDILRDQASRPRISSRTSAISRAREGRAPSQRSARGQRLLRGQMMRAGCARASSIQAMLSTLATALEHLGGRLGDARLAMAVQALVEDRVDDRLAAARRWYRAPGARSTPDRQHVRVAGHVVHADRVAAVQQRALAVAQHRDLRAADSTLRRRSCGTPPSSGTGRSPGPGCPRAAGCRCRDRPRADSRAGRRRRSASTGTGTPWSCAA